MMVRCVIAGIDGSEPGLAAARWAAREAMLRGSGLRLIHVWPPDPYAPPVLDRAVSELALRHPGLEVQGEQADGRAPDVLADAGHTAGLLVVGSRGLGGFPGLLLGSVAVETAGRSPCPVALVPEQPPGGERPPEVVLGIDTRHPAAPATHYAFDAAQRREARLRAVHAWSLPLPYGSPWAPYAVTEGYRAAWEDEEVQLLHDVLRGHRRAYPAVPVVNDVRLLSPAKALVKASARAELLVVGRPCGSLSGVPHTVAHHARCPVVLVP
ncbi:universal stress protein [Streptomyces sp. NBC_01537]|uniref:universal stress protein n=1 Tax=Streptomyces sp. NBC_01537 TaxID=2903896 RepID=UPI0038663EB2